MNFTERQGERPLQTDSWFRVRLRTLLVVTAVGALVLAMVFHYRTHLFWRFFAARQGLTDVRSVSVNRMPDESSPKGWVACRFGSLYFSLPPELTENPQTAPTGAPILALGEDSRSMVIALPTASAEMSTYLRTDVGMPPEGESLSLTMLRLACLQSGSDEFRWSMTPREVRWLAWRITMGRLLRPGATQWAETLLTDDLEGVAYFHPKHVELDWQSKDGRVGGYIHFIEESEEREIEPAWVRAVCRSLRFSGSCFPDQMSQDVVKAQFQIITE